MFVCIALLGALLWSQSIQAETEGETQSFVNWYYAVEFGTGTYRVGDSTVYIFRIPLSYTLKEADFETGTWGSRIIFPVTFGYHNINFNLKDIIDTVVEEDFATFTLTPGMEWEVPYQENLSFFPYFYAGYGSESSHGTDAWIYGTGVRTRSNEKWGAADITYGTALTFAGYNSSTGQSRATTSVRLGVNAMNPLGTTFFKKAATWGWHIIGFFYFNELDFNSSERESLSISNEIEFALMLGTKEPISVYGVEFDRVGLAYRIGEELRAIRLIGGFPF